MRSSIYINSSSLILLVITYLIMFKLLFLTLCIALGAQYAYSCCFALGRKDANSCCFPRQMEGLQRISIAKKINGRGYAISGLMRYAYDLDKDKEYQAGTVYVNGRSHREHNLYDYANNKLYSVVNNQCAISTLRTKMLDCIPKTANKIYTTYYGVDDNKIDVQGHYFTAGNIHVTMTTMVDNCVVVGRSLTTTNTVVNTGYLGLTLRITNSSVFDIPGSCARDSTSTFLKKEKSVFADLE